MGMILTFKYKISKTEVKKLKIEWHSDDTLTLLEGVFNGGMHVSFTKVGLQPVVDMFRTIFSFGDLTSFEIEVDGKNTN